VKILVIALGIVFAVFVGLVAYVRLVDLPTAQFHQIPREKPAGRHAGKTSFYVVIDVAPGTGPDQLAQFVKVIADTPSTRLLAGTPDDGHVSFVHRSKIWGFPDITNIALVGDQLRLRSAARFGGSDHGVNRDRIERWLKALGQL